SSLKCATASTGNRYGWHLPSVQELSSLVDVSTKTLPAGHPFDALAGTYWTSTTYAFDAAQAWAVVLGGPGFWSDIHSTLSALAAHPYWCVRGGSPRDQQ